MAKIDPLAIAVGGFVLITCYGVRQWRRERTAQRLPGSAGGTDDPFAIPPSGGPQAAALVAEFVNREGDAHGWESRSGGLVCCQVCGTEYPAGILWCDCGGATVEDEDSEETAAALDEAPAQAAPPTLTGAGGPSRDAMVCAHVADTLWQAQLLKSLLENHGIPCLLYANIVSNYLSFHSPGQQEVHLYVPTGDLAAAQVVLQAQHGLAEEG